MADGEWYVQVHPLGGRPPEAPVHFADFAGTLAFVKAFKERPAGNILRAHVPTRATYMQCQQLIQNGATPVWGLN
jgi:hypothetical protein